MIYGVIGVQWNPSPKNSLNEDTLLKQDLLLKKIESLIIGV